MKERCFLHVLSQDKEIPIIDILNGVTGYNSREARVEQIPGSTFEYSNAGFCVIQLILESITGKKSVDEMIKPAFGFSWMGLGIFRGDDAYFSNGWGENGQCMLKINCKNHTIGVVMTNKNPEVPQEESGVEKLVDRM